MFDFRLKHNYRMSDDDDQEIVKIKQAIKTAEQFSTLYYR